MKKIFYVGALAAMLALSGCTAPGGLQSSGGAAANSSNQSQTSSVLGSLLSGFLNYGNELTAEKLLGTWRFSGSDCVFETENLLLKAGGEAAAMKLEAQLDGLLSKVGFTPDVCTYAFNPDGTYLAVIGGRTITGNYQLDAANKKITLTYLAGLGQMTAHVQLNGKTISFLYESDKLLKLATTLSTVTGGKSGETLSQLLNAYDGLLVGLKFQR